MNSYVLLVLDSCRYDSMAAAWPTLRNIPRLGELNRAYSFSSWTFASHILFTLGRLPWIDRRPDTTHQKTELADLRLWKTRLGLTDDHPFQQERDLRTGLHRLGYRLNAITSANPLTEDSRFMSFVDDLVSVGQFENCLERVLPKLDFSNPQYLIINICETHYPYYDGAYDPQFSPYYLHGFAAQMRAAAADQVVTIPTYHEALLSTLRLRQIESIRYVDSVIPKLFSLLPSDTCMGITADHGDCFGEDGFVGHGEVWNKMVLEVPFLEGRVPTVTT
jgi:hypothetical protein